MSRMSQATPGHTRHVLTKENKKPITFNKQIEQSRCFDMTIVVKCEEYKNAQDGLFRRNKSVDHSISSRMRARLTGCWH
jgi:hypothetical protein